MYTVHLFAAYKSTNSNWTLSDRGTNYKKMNNWGDEGITPLKRLF